MARQRPSLRGAFPWYSRGMRGITISILALLFTACSSGTVTTSTGASGAGGWSTSAAGGAGGASTSSAGGAGVGGAAGASSAGGSGGGSGGATAAGGNAAGGSGGSGPLGVPIAAPEGVWTWVPFPDAVCANGQTTGIGVNLAKPGARVLIYLEGGGACWDDDSCYVQKSAANIDSGYGPADFAAVASKGGLLLQPDTAFDRSAQANPFKESSFVYVPYCTGDVHAGDNVTSTGAHTTHHVGHKNLKAYLARLVPTFAGTDRVVLAGSSAGGFGALVNWWQTHLAFGAARVDMIDDSGTPMPLDVAGGGVHAAQQYKAWRLANTLPPGCADCQSHLDALFPFYAQALPGSRGALLSYAVDTVLPKYFGITEAQFTTGLVEIGKKHIEPSANLRYFVPGGAGHVLFWTPAVSVQGVSLVQFVTKMVTDDPTWSNASP